MLRNTKIQAKYPLWKVLSNDSFNTLMSKKIRRFSNCWLHRRVYDSLWLDYCVDCWICNREDGTTFHSSYFAYSIETVRRESSCTPFLIVPWCCRVVLTCSSGSNPSFIITVSIWKPFPNYAQSCPFCIVYYSLNLLLL